jgi:hypothetical protein
MALNMISIHEGPGFIWNEMSSRMQSSKLILVFCHLNQMTGFFSYGGSLLMVSDKTTNNLACRRCWTKVLPNPTGLLDNSWSTPTPTTRLSLIYIRASFCSGLEFGRWCLGVGYAIVIVVLVMRYQYRFVSFVRIQYSFFYVAALECSSFHPPFNRSRRKTFHGGHRAKDLHYSELLIAITILGSLPRMMYSFRSRRTPGNQAGW